MHPAMFSPSRRALILGGIAALGAAASCRPILPTGEEGGVSSAATGKIGPLRTGSGLVSLSPDATVEKAALQQARNRGLPLPSGVVLLSPWVDLSLQSWSVTSASLLGTTPYTMESLALVARFYLDGRPATDPIASPMFGGFEGFPPMLIHASKGDILYDDAVRLAEEVRGVGGDLTIRLWTDETHVWERMGTPKARQSIRLAADFIRRQLDRGEPHRS